MKGRRAIVVLLVGLALAGCTTTVHSHGYPVPRPNRGDGATPLAERPPSSEVVASYERMGTGLRAAVSAAVPTVVWVVRRDPGASGCGGQLAGKGGRTTTLQPWGAPGAIPDADWPRALRAASDAIAPYGFGSFATIRNGPGDHDVEAVGPYGATVDLGSGINVVMDIRTGCHPDR